MSRIGFRFTDLLKVLGFNEALHFHTIPALAGDGPGACFCYVNLAIDKDLPSQYFKTWTMRLSEDGLHLFVDYGAGGNDAALLSIVVQSRGVPLAYNGEITRHKASDRLCLIEGPNNSISISPFLADDPDYESNHINLLDEHSRQKLSFEALRIIVTNIMRASGVHFIEE